MVFEYFSYGVAVAVAALLCRGLRAAVLQRENASMRAYVLRGSFRSRLFACLSVQAFSIFYAGVHAKVSPYYLFPLARMANPILTSPVLNPCKLVNYTYMAEHCERSARLEGSEFICDDGGWFAYPSAFEACYAARLQNGYQANG